MSGRGLTRLCRSVARPVVARPVGGALFMAQVRHRYSLREEVAHLLAARKEVREQNPLEKPEGFDMKDMLENGQIELAWTMIEDGGIVFEDPALFGCRCTDILAASLDQFGPRRVEFMLERMLHSAVFPHSAEAWLPLIKFVAVTGHPQRAVEMLYEMSRSGLKPDKEVFAFIVAANETSPAGEQQDLLDWYQGLHGEKFPGVEALLESGAEQDIVAFSVTSGDKTEPKFEDLSAEEVIEMWQKQHNVKDA